MTPRLLIRGLISVVALAPFMAHTLGHIHWHFLERLENMAYDARLALTLPQDRPSDVVIIDIDEKSLAAEGQWPWPRTKLARLVDALFSRYSAAVVGFDVAFPEPDRDAAVLRELRIAVAGEDERIVGRVNALADDLAGDVRFAGSLADRPTVLGYVFRRVAEDGRPGVGVLPDPVFAATADPTRIALREPAGYTANLPILQHAARGAGFFDTETLDVDGVIRRVPVVRRYQGGLYESLALAVARVALGAPPVTFAFHSGPAGPRDGLDLEWLTLGDRRIPVDEDVAVLVPYAGPLFSYPYVSASDILSGAAPVESLSGKIVLVGTSSPGLRDLRSTPVGNVFTGVEVHANIISGILDGGIKHRPQYVVGIAAVLLLTLALLLTLIVPRLPVLSAALLTLALIVAVAAGNFALWQGGLVTPLAAPVAMAGLLYLFQLTYGYAIESRGKRQLSNLFGHYVPPELVEEMDRNPDRITMATDSRVMSVLFADVRGFTGISENLRARELSRLINAILTPLTEIIHAHRGTIDKYMGDAVMAFWGAPLDDPGHARNALRAALEMQPAMDALRARFEAEGWPAIELGVGISTGRMRVGNMGSQFRVAYTVVGDAVNLGSRLEGLTRQYGVSVAVSDETRRAASDFEFLELDRVRVKGKAHPVAVFEPLGPADALDSDTRRMVKRHTVALRAYRNADWDAAEAEFFALRQMHPDRHIFSIYLDRVAHFRAQPPQEDWSGVYKVLTK